MLDQQNRDAEPIPNGVDAGQKLCRFRGVHAGGRLVQQQNLHIGGQRAGDLQLALLAIGQAGGGNVRLVPQAADLQQLQCLFRGLPLRLPEPRRAERSVKQVIVQILGTGRLHVFDHRHVRKQTDVLKGSRDTGLHELVDLFPVQGNAVQQDGALRGNVHTGKQVEYGGLSRAVGADEAHQLAGIDGEAKILHSVQPSEGNAQMLGLQHRRFRCFRHGAWPPSAQLCPRSGRCATPGAWRATGECRTGQIPCCP